MSENDIIDRIDALVAEQLANYPNRSGYDHDVNQERCRCGRDWHGLPITQRIDGMRSYGEFDPGYVYAEDDSPVMCVGSNTPGPWRQVGMWQLPEYPFDDLAWFEREVMPRVTVTNYLQRIRERMDSGYRMPSAPTRHQIYDGPPTGQWWRCDNPQQIEVEINRDSQQDDLRSGWDYSVRRHSAVMRITTPRDLNRGAYAADFDRRTEIVQLGFDPDTHDYMRFGEVDRRPVWLEVFTDQRPPIGDWHLANQPEPDTRTPQQRALPQPSTTPPMWAHDPTRSRRPRRRRGQPTRQGIA